MFSPAPTSPRVELLPLKPALPVGRSSDVIILARIHPGVDTERGPRLPLNLSLVLDRSGSMQGTPIDMARKAAQTAIRALQPQDRVSVVTFDTVVRPLIPPQLVRDPEALCRKIEGVTASGTTALHAGWLQGATHVAEHHDVQALNRVLLLSDGQANEGETRQSVITAQVRSLTERDVTTSTVGLGQDYQEDLMRAMADAGDGNYEHIEDAARLPTSNSRGMATPRQRTASMRTFTSVWPCFPFVRSMMNSRGRACGSKASTARATSAGLGG
ncbi:vWA domain-containing protein [Deinococcus hopiensis]|uniref:Uncharacterized protein containing a von Willebrand factor type A (VWA) domain n=1 Tax=Deinococcus hopiensis KR-140 TaxID=695939 RepID=A0A1W1ULK9_9DEIO|nr:VWA domain-containing protein [Deinococcus hopiensis]SMB82015.1 Uncharacterized protein containing a von Willebrand factor type A (vWA) domain [Deinococcus hopiensis KR-140]